MKIIPLLLIASMAEAAASPRSPLAVFAFDVAPGADHPSQAADLAWLDQGLASGVAATGPEGEAVLSAPHFQVVYGDGVTSVNDVFRPDSVIDRNERTELRLGTAMAMSQLGLGSEDFDIAFGSSFERDKNRLQRTGVEGSRQWLDLSLAVHAGSWRLGASLAEAAEISSDSGMPSDRRVSLNLGRMQPDGLAWGVGVDLPMESGGEAGLRVGLTRDFRQALEFRGELATTYSKGVDPIDGSEKMVRRSLELRLGTRVKFRPWVATDDPDWMRRIVDPAPAEGDFLLRGWVVGVSAGWDLVSGEAKPALELSHAF